MGTGRTMKFVLLAAAGLLAAGCACGEDKPNVVFILADDLGFNDVSFHGSLQIPTPNIDALANDGIILNNYYVNSICTPTRSCLMTGKYPIHTGLWHGTIPAGSPYGLALNETILPQFMQKQGYSTHMVGKWHLGFFRKEYTPTYRGFQSHLGYWSGHKDYYDHTAEEREFWGLDMHRNLSIADDLYDQYTTTLFTNEASKIIQQHDQAKPLFLYLAHLAVHSANSYSPLQAPREYVQRMMHIKDVKRRMYAAMVSALDDSVGGVVKSLSEKGMINNTIILFSTDNGGPAAGFDLNYASNWPLRGVKDTLWEGGVRGAGFVWSRKLPKPSRVSKQMMHVSDWLPTIYSAAGGDIADLGKIDGVNMWPALVSNLTSPRNHILHNIDNIRRIAALRKGNYKVVIGHSYGNNWNGWYPPEGVSKRDKVKLHKFSSPANDVLGTKRFLQRAAVECGPKPANASTNCNPVAKPCLFDVVKDPCEYLNIADKFPKLLEDLMRTLLEFNRTVVPARNTGRDNRSDPKLHGYSWVSWMDDDVGSPAHHV